MPKLLACVFLLFGCHPAIAQEEAVDAVETAEAVEVAEAPKPAKLPSVEECIPSSVAKLGPPTPFMFHNGLVTAVTASNDAAQTATLQGLNHLHGGWEFEASRHFAVAMKEDPNCLMATWGMVMCLLAPEPETDENRIAALERLMHLISEGAGTELERGFAYGLIKYMDEGPLGAATAFRRVADKFPGEIQAEIFAALFGRTGYDELGSITADQEAAEKRLLALIERAPDNAVPLHALLLIRAEAPDLRPSLELARRLCQLVPDYPPYFHVLGHYEWRSGEHARASSAFGRAASLFYDWMQKNDVSPADCPGWIRAECYRVIAMASRGDFDNALAAAEKIANTTLDPDRPSAAGTRLLLWDARLLPARILMRRGAKGDSAKALASLPSPEEGEPFRQRSLSYWWVDGLRIALEAHRLLETTVLDKAEETIGALSFHGQAMAERQTVATAIGERSEWLRSFRALEVLASELRGKLALAGPAAGHGSAFNWFRAAADRQKPSTMLSTPPLLTPLVMRLGDFYMSREKPKEAIEAYTEALAAFPQDQQTLVRLREAYVRSEQPLKAAEIDEMLKGKTE